MPQIVPREVVDLSQLQGRVEAVLDVLDWLALVGTRGVGEYVARGRAWRTSRVQFLEGGERRRVQGQRQCAATFRAGDPHDPVREVDLVPAQVEQASTSQAGVRGEDDLLLQVR